jgi:hypothetical protein
LSGQTPLAFGLRGTSSQNGGNPGADLMS